MRYRKDGKLVGSRHVETHCSECEVFMAVGYKGRCRRPGHDDPIGHNVNEKCEEFVPTGARQSGLGDWNEGAEGRVCRH